MNETTNLRPVTTTTSFASSFPQRFVKCRRNGIFSSRKFPAAPQTVPGTCRHMFGSGFALGHYGRAGCRRKGAPAVPGGDSALSSVFHRDARRALRLGAGTGLDSRRPTGIATGRSLPRPAHRPGTSRGQRRSRPVGHRLLHRVFETRTLRKQSKIPHRLRRRSE
jgi:hypothetical protein